MQSVKILVSRKGSAVIANPVGTFKGHGGFIGTLPFRSMGKEDPPGELGAIIVELLAKSGPTGYHIRDHEKYKKDHPESRTSSILEDALGKNQSTGSIYKRFMSYSVDFTPGQKSWKIQSWIYDNRTKMNHCDLLCRVPLSAGATVLAERILRDAAVNIK